MALDESSKNVSVIISILFITSFVSLLAAGQQQAPVADRPQLPILPPSHYQFWLKNNPSALKIFEKICPKATGQNPDGKQMLKTFYSSFRFDDPTSSIELVEEIVDNVCSKINLIRKSCWGYENSCDNIYLMPECNISSSDSESEQEKKIKWFSQADFGFVLDRRRELSSYCAPDKHSNHSIRSSLDCTKYFRSCRGENLYIKFDNSHSTFSDGPMMLRRGNVGGWNCDLQPKRIVEEGAQNGFLKSWFNELQHYDRLHNIQPSDACKQSIEKLTFFIQLDPSANMYQYFSSFLNLYATMHLNNRFSEDNQLILWDNKQPKSPFEIMWKVFSKNEPKDLSEFKDKQVCFKKFIFAMPPRMVDGLYQNTPLVEGCSKSGLFDAFNKHVLYKLDIGRRDPDSPRNNSSIRVTIVSRSTQTRRILNEQDLKTAADNLSQLFSTQIVDLANMTFLEQLEIIHKTDILVGIHGSGLTHTLFLPDWAALFELRDCKDKSYRDLARLRGVSYHTLKVNEDSGDKSMNFEIDVSKFVEGLKSAAEEVKKRRRLRTENFETDGNIVKEEAKIESDAITKADPIKSTPVTEDAVKPMTNQLLSRMKAKKRGLAKPADHEDLTKVDAEERRASESNQSRILDESVQQSRENKTNLSTSQAPVDETRSYESNQSRILDESVQQSRENKTNLTTSQASVDETPRRKQFRIGNKGPAKDKSKPQFRSDL